MFHIEIFLLFEMDLVLLVEKMDSILNKPANKLLIEKPDALLIINMSPFS